MKCPARFRKRQANGICRRCAPPRGHGGDVTLPHLPRSRTASVRKQGRANATRPGALARPRSDRSFEWLLHALRSRHRDRGIKPAPRGGRVSDHHDRPGGRRFRHRRPGRPSGCRVGSARTGRAARASPPTTRESSSRVQHEQQGHWMNIPGRPPRLRTPEGAHLAVRRNFPSGASKRHPGDRLLHDAKPS
jgi:hypothetical protein